MSTLYQQWQNIAYDETADRSQLEKFWGTYFQIEKEIYEKLLSNPDEAVKGTVKELAEKFGQEVLTMIGFLDGINESLMIELDLDTVEEDTVISLAFDKERLYKNMVAAKADWLYELPQWKEIFSEEELKKFRPSLDVNEAEDAIYNRDFTDVTDILKELINDEKKKNKGNL